MGHVPVLIVLIDWLDSTNVNALDATSLLNVNKNSCFNYQNNPISILLKLNIPFQKCLSLHYWRVEKDLRSII